MIRTSSAQVAANRLSITSSSDGGGNANTNSSGNLTPVSQRALTPPPPSSHANIRSSFASIERPLSTNALAQLAALHQHQQHHHQQQQHRSSITSRNSRISSLTRESSTRSIDHLKMDISDLTNLFGRSHEQQLLQSVFVRVLQNKGSCDDEQDEKDGEVKNEKYKPEGYSSSLPPLPRPQQQSQSQPSIVRTGTSASKDDLISSSSSDNDEKGTSNSRKNGTTFDRRKKRRRDAGLMPVREVVLVHGKAGTMAFKFPNTPKRMFFEQQKAPKVTIIRFLSISLFF